MMLTAKEQLSQLVDALPSEFEFYHLGEVKKVDSPPPEKEIPNQLSSHDELSGIAFRFNGDISALLVIFFSKDLDSSVYSELGNIIASQLATQLSNKNGIQLMISPPRSIHEKHLANLLRSSNSTFRRTYVHLYKNLVIPVEALLLPAPLEGIGHA